MSNLTYVERAMSQFNALKELIDELPGTQETYQIKISMAEEHLRLLEHLFHSGILSTCSEAESMGHEWFSYSAEKFSDPDREYKLAGKSFALATLILMAQVGSINTNEAGTLALFKQSFASSLLHKAKINAENLEFCTRRLRERNLDDSACRTLHIDSLLMLANIDALLGNLVEAGERIKVACDQACEFGSVTESQLRQFQLAIEQFTSQDVEGVAEISDYQQAYNRMLGFGVKSLDKDDEEFLPLNSHLKDQAA